MGSSSTAADFRGESQAFLPSKLSWRSKVKGLNGKASGFLNGEDTARNRSGNKKCVLRRTLISAPEHKLAYVRTDWRWAKFRLIHVNPMPFEQHTVFPPSNSRGIAASEQQPAGNWWRKATLLESGQSGQRAGLNIQYLFWETPTSNSNTQSLIKCFLAMVKCKSIFNFPESQKRILGDESRC